MLITYLGWYKNRLKKVDQWHERLTALSISPLLVLVKYDQARYRRYVLQQQNPPL
jgi:hypothetical protein